MFDVVTGRRNFGRIFAGVAGVLAVGGGATAAVAAVRKSNAEEDERFRSVPWPYPKLEPDQVAFRAFKGFDHKRCMYGTFEALVGSAADKLGGRYHNFPFDVMAYGADGIGGWGTVCGALNGAAAAIHLLSKEPGPIVDSLFAWYEREPLPNVQLTSSTAAAQTIAGSPLCHVSIARWCAATGKKADDPERVHRCGALVASVARRTTELLNTQLAGRALPVVPASAAAQCGSCHTQGAARDDARSKMDCNGCHFHLVVPEHPKT